MQSDNIRDSIIVGRCFTPGNFDLKKCRKFKSTGTISASTDSFNFNQNLNGLRDLLKVMTMYYDYVDSQTKCNFIFFLSYNFKINLNFLFFKVMDKDGNIPIGFKPATLKMNFKNFVLTLKTFKSHVIPLKVNPNIDREDLFHLVNHHFKQFIDDSIVEAFQLPQVIDKYGFGISIDSNDVITIVYSFGGKNRPGKSEKPLDDYYKWSYVSPKGSKNNYSLNNI
jgi:hypothetical protein